MTNRKPFPILSALRREGDTFTLGALRLWMYDYSYTPPQVVANDNDPDTRPVEWETNTYELSAEDLIAAYEEDEKNRDDPGYVVQYSADLHGDSRKSKVRRTKKPMPPLDVVDAHEELARHMDAERVRAWLGASADVLDMAIGPYTYRDVAKHVGVEGSPRTLESAGKHEVKSAAGAFYREVA